MSAEPVLANESYFPLLTGEKSQAPGKFAERMEPYPPSLLLPLLGLMCSVCTLPHRVTSSIGLLCYRSFLSKLRNWAGEAVHLGEGICHQADGQILITGTHMVEAEN